MLNSLRQKIIDQIFEFMDDTPTENRVGTTYFDGVSALYQALTEIKHNNPTKKVTVEKRKGDTKLLSPDLAEDQISKFLKENSLEQVNAAQGPMKFKRKGIDLEWIVYDQMPNEVSIGLIHNQYELDDAKKDEWIINIHRCYVYGGFKQCEYVSSFVLSYVRPPLPKLE